MFSNFFKKKLFLFNFHIKIFYLYILYLFTLIIFTYFYSILILKIHPIYINDMKEMNFINLGWENNFLILNILNHNEFKFNYLGIDFYSAKYPLLPATIALIAKISKNFYFILTVKNIIFFSILFWSIYFFVSNNIKNKKLIYFFIILISLHFNPYNFHVMSNFYFEDFANAILLPSLYLLILSKSNLLKKYLFIGLIISLLFLSKSSMTIFGIIFPIIYIIFSKKRVLALIPFFIVMLISVNWSYYSFKKTGYYPFFTNNSSFNQAQLALALQEDFHKIYPFYSIDTIHNTKEILLDKNKYGFNEIKNEWEFNALFKVRNKQYIKDNFLRYFKDSFLKLNFIFFYPYQDGNGSDKNINNKELKFSMIINKIFLIIGCFTLIFSIVKKIKVKEDMMNEISYLFILLLIIPIFLIGWATSKHLIGICNVSIIYLLNYYFLKFRENSHASATYLRP